MEYVSLLFLPSSSYYQFLNVYASINKYIFILFLHSLKQGVLYFVFLVNTILEIIISLYIQNYHSFEELQ